jgi:hypothetical protein
MRFACEKQERRAGEFAVSEVEELGVRMDEQDDRERSAKR